MANALSLAMTSRKFRRPPGHKPPEAYLDPSPQQPKAREDGLEIPDVMTVVASFDDATIVCRLSRIEALIPLVNRDDRRQLDHVVALLRREQRRRASQ